MKTWLRSLAVAALPAILCLALVGCSKSPGLEAAKDIFDRQAAAMSSGDIAAYMATMDPNSPAYSGTETALKMLAGKKIDIKVDKIELVSETDTEAEVRAVISTTAASIPGFRPNTVTTLNSLKKIDGKWLLTNGKQEKIEYK